MNPTDGAPRECPAEKTPPSKEAIFAGLWLNAPCWRAVRAGHPSKGHKNTNVGKLMSKCKTHIPGS